MRATEFHIGLHGPRPAYSLRKTLLGTALAAAAFLAAVLAVTHPAATAAALLAAVAARTAVRRLDRFRQTRRRDGRNRRVCVPTTDVCVEA
jgi:hypothetical protein